MNAAYESAIHATRECIRLAPVLDAAMDAVLADPLDFVDSAGDALS